MISHRTWDFKKMSDSLPGHIQALAAKNFTLWKSDPWHPSLDFKQRKSGSWSVRIGDHHRAIGDIRGDKMIWFWIGSHEAYNKL